MPFAFPRKFHGDRRGNVAMMYALAVPVLLFGAGLAIDFTHAAQVRTELNAAADAAVLAALTPSMMQQSNATAQTAAQNMFNGQIATLTSLASGDTTVTITIVNPNNNPLIRNVTVAYTAQNENIFASVLGAPTFALAGSSTASASMAANINFYLLLDNSPSMALPATAAGINSMIALTSQQDNGNGCAFACHQASTGNSDTAGNPCLKGSTYSTPTLKSSGGNGGNTYCASSQGTQIDDFALARKNSIELRLDALNTGIGDLMTDAYTTQQNAASIPPVYQFAAYTMDSSWQIGMSSSNNYNNLMAMTASYVSGWTAASPNFGVMEYYANNDECGNAACTSNGNGGDVATSFSNALGAMNTIMPNPGQGTNVAGDTPQEVLFIVTDGVEDDTSSSCSQPLSSGRCQAPINPALCTTIKNRGIRIAILYTDYLQVTSNSWYVTWIEPFQSQIGPQLEACASPGLFYDAGLDSSNLGGALQALFNTVVQTAHLTQ
ncbi:MAG: pilus assembly protein TadG-related protein [Roseiarcus sp.]|jgi:Flp pilus assembly protein TadG